MRRVWLAADNYSDLIGLEETLVYIRKVLAEQGPFDAIWGFSQG